MACKQIEREVFPSREFVERSRDFVWLEVQRFAGRSEPSETAIRYGVMAYPQFIVTDAEGHEVARGDVREGRGFFDRARAAWKSHRPAPAPPVSPRLKRLLDPTSAQAAAAELA
ncbi:MAG TPA: hypothetical protein VKF62_12180, partial [Planctomycetota bacterium]|nr:hypothetical protein [Planctomycetota bacterium]